MRRRFSVLKRSRGTNTSSEKKRSKGSRRTNRRSALALAEVEDAHRHVEQLVVRDLEQLVARVGVEDLEQRLVVVAAAREGGALEHAAPPCGAGSGSRSGSRGRRCACRGRGSAARRPPPTKSRYAARWTVARVLALRQRDRARVARSSAAPSGPPPAESRRMPRPGLRSPSLAVAEEREVVVGEPVEERGRLVRRSSRICARPPRAPARASPASPRPRSAPRRSRARGAARARAAGWRRSGARPRRGSRTRRWRPPPAPRRA